VYGGVGATNSLAGLDDEVPFTSPQRSDDESWDAAQSADIECWDADNTATKDATVSKQQGKGGEWWCRCY
jgi:hypothetical protein